MSTPWSQCPTNITAQDRRDMMDWDLRNRHPEWFTEEVQADEGSDQTTTRATAAGSAPVTGEVGSSFERS